MILIIKFKTEKDNVRWPKNRSGGVALIRPVRKESHFPGDDLLLVDHALLPFAAAVSPDTPGNISFFQIDIMTQDQKSDTNIDPKIEQFFRLQGDKGSR
jgi:hypothetical protein